MGVKDGEVSIQTDEDETLVLDKKAVAAIHAIDEWEDDFAD